MRGEKILDTYFLLLCALTSNARDIDLFIYALYIVVSRNEILIEKLDQLIFGLNLVRDYIILFEQIKLNPDNTNASKKRHEIL